MSVELFDRVTEIQEGILSALVFLSFSMLGLQVAVYQNHSSWLSLLERVGRTQQGGIDSSGSLGSPTTVMDSIQHRRVTPNPTTHVHYRRIH